MMVYFTTTLAVIKIKYPIFHQKDVKHVEMVFVIYVILECISLIMTCV
jgi:hypothetical protein